MADAPRKVFINIVDVHNMMMWSMTNSKRAKLVSQSWEAIFCVLCCFGEAKRKF
jgi:hypothetical protein